MTDDTLWSRFEDYHHRHEKLIKSRAYLDAAKLWEQAAEEFESEAASDHAASAMGFAGSAYSCARMEEAALQAYMKAADLSPEDPLHHLKVGSYLLDFLDEPEKALSRLDQAITLAANNPDTHYCLSDALGLQGVAWLRMGRQTEANQRLATTCSAASSGPMKPMLDLRLAHEFVERGEHLEKCAQLADHALEWAKVTKNDDLRTRATHLKKTIETNET